MQESSLPIQDRAQSPGASWALAVLVACLAAYFGPRLARNEVLYPHTGAAEAGAHFERARGLDHWYLDVALLYVPETAVHLDPNRESWLATWTPHNGLGRPLFHVGFGSAFLPARLAALGTDDPFVHYTWMSSLGVVLSALFAFGFLWARGLSSVACLGAALSLSVGSIYPTWPMIPLVQWGFAWAFAALWAVEVWCQRRSWFALMAIAFAVHGILLTGFLEHTLGLGWMVAGWVLMRTLKDGARGERGRLLLGVVAASVAGVLSVLPVYADLLVDWQNSTRGAEVGGFDPVFRGIVWPTIFAVVDEGAPGLQSFSLGAAVFCLAAVGAVRWSLHRAWYWLGWAVLMSAATSHEGTSAILSWMGLSRSAWAPVFTVPVPAVILLALGLDGLWRRPRRGQAVLLATVLIAGVVSVATLSPDYGRALDPALVLGAVLSMLAAFGFFVRSRSEALGVALVLALVAPAAVTLSARLVVWKDRASIFTESELSGVLRERCRDGSRYAWVGKRPRPSRWMPPNVDPILGLRGLQSYDHLPSKAFHQLMEPLRPMRERIPYVRRFTRLAEEEALLNDGLALANIGTVLSIRQLSPEVAHPVRRVGKILVSEPRQRRSMPATVALAESDEVSRGEWSVSAAVLQEAPVTPGVTERKNDALTLALPRRTQPNLLILDHEYHPRWLAMGDRGRLTTVRVNGLHQGVIVPAGCIRVRLRFSPWSPWIALSQWAFALAALGWIASVALRRRGLARTGRGPAAGLLLLVSVTVLVSSCGSEPPDVASSARRPDVFLLMADTFRADNLGFDANGAPLTPELDAFASEARVFTEARTPATWTLPAHASLFSGLYPSELGITDAKTRLDESVETLAEIFQAAGYRTVAVTDAGYVSPGFGMDQGFESFVMTGNMTEPDFDRTVEGVKRALEGAVDDDRPLFLFVQSYRAHSWTVGERTRERLAGRLEFRPNETFTARDWRRRFMDLLREADHGVPMGGAEYDDVVGAMIPNYRGAAADTSTGFGEVLDALRAHPRFEESVTAFTSDHGEAFGWHGVVSHGNGVWDEQGRIPLLIRAPGLETGEDRRSVSLIDLPRTLTSLAGVEPALAWRGVDLGQPGTPARPLFLFQTLPAKTRYVAAISNTHKWIHIDPGGGSAEPGELRFVYDLAEDPLESRNLAQKMAGTEEASRVRAALVDIMGAAIEPSAARPDEALDRQLRGMGYGPR